MAHSFVTIAIPFHVKYSDRVEKCLDKLGTPLLDDHVTSKVSSLRAKLDKPGIIHFLSITVVRGDDERTADKSKTEDSFIIIEASVDGDMVRAVDTIAATLEAEIDQVLSAADRSTGGAPLPAFLGTHRHDVGQGWFSTKRLRPGLNYDGTPEMTVERIKQEAALAKTIEEMLQESTRRGTALGVLEKVRSRLWAEGEKWAFVAAPAPCLQSNNLSKLSVGWGFGKSAAANLLWPFLVLLFAPAIIFLFSLVRPAVRAHWSVFSWEAFLATAGILLIEAVVVGGGYFLLRHREKTDVCDAIAPKASHVERLMKRETFGAQNHLAASSTMKPGWFRHLTLRIGLRAAGCVAVYLSRPSFLGPTGVIHFARWILLPTTNKLLFMSNYDGAWETYLEDFIEEAHQGVTGIWSNTRGFPRTAALFSQGATDGDRLRWWTRRQQHPSWLWYVAYPTLSLAQIRRNAAIRQGIAAALTEADAADWLSCFGSSPRPANALQRYEISTLVFGGLPRLRSGACLLLRLSDSKKDNKKWLAETADTISYGGQLNASKVLVLGFAPSGLKKLGLTGQHLATFSVAFQQGNAAPWRARTLGDIGADDPENWLWGVGSKDTPHGETLSAGTVSANQADAVMLLYAREPGELDELSRTQIRQCEKHGGGIVFDVEFKDLPQREHNRRPLPKEPFGFLDGISNPIIRGIRSPQPKQAIHLVEPGEFILGYPDNLDYMPPSPSVSACDDPTDMLPSAGAILSRQRPDFSQPSVTGQHDFGMNGTYLVVRQLEQDTIKYDHFLKTAAYALTQSGRAPGNLSVSLRDWIAAKMVGRWHDGTSLVRHPDAPGTSLRPPEAIMPDNEFSFRLEDPNGLRCPFGAHIRRANPRDSFVAGLEQQEGATNTQVEESLTEQIREQLRITNRHRILRVGRPYEKEGTSGLVFMCLSADIERQFEFVQQSWVLGPSFHGLQNEIDPLVGNRHGSETFSIPTADGPLWIKDIKDFVRVRGGGYFFLPGRQALRFLAC
jgi:deferrochelatase/peroxidase EfeB